ncbi:MAG TPA: acyl-CoA desaturase, partial [Actinomycetota bacterium]
MLRPLLYVLGTLLVTQAAVIATSVYLHRGLAHRALRLHPLADWGFRFVLWFTTGQNRREWVAVHRKHHAFTDKEGDPHSPIFFGIWRVVLFGTKLYHNAAHDPLLVAQYGKGTPQDAVEHVYGSLSLLGPVITLVT